MSSHRVFGEGQGVLLLAFFFYATRIVLQGPSVPPPHAAPEQIRPGVDSAAARSSGR